MRREKMGQGEVGENQIKPTGFNSTATRLPALFLALKECNKTAQSNALGSNSTAHHALKGHNTVGNFLFVVPFQGVEKFLRPLSQGVALGCFVALLRSEEKMPYPERHGNGIASWAWREMRNLPGISLHRCQCL